MKLIILLSIVLLATISSRKVKTGTSALPDKALGFKDYSTQLRQLYQNAKNEVKAEAEKVNGTPKALTKIKLRANELYPTQGEIAISKSLKFLVYNIYGDKGSATANIDDVKSQCTATTGDGASIAGNPLVVTKITGKTGYAIIDGHHRWAQFFLAQPDCQVYCLIADGEFASVDDALKSGLYLQVLQTEKTEPNATKLKSEVGDHNNNDQNNQLNLIGASYSDTTKASANLKAALEYYYSTDNLSDKVKADRKKDTDKNPNPDIPTRIQQTIDAVGANAYEMYKRGEDARTPNIPREVMPQTDSLDPNTKAPISSIPNFSQTTATKKKSKKLK